MSSRLRVERHEEEEKGRMRSRRMKVDRESYWKMTTRGRSRIHHEGIGYGKQYCSKELESPSFERRLLKLLHLPHSCCSVDRPFPAANPSR